MAYLEINEDEFLKMSAPQQRLVLFKNTAKHGKIRFHQKVLYIIVGGLTTVVGFIARVVFMN